MVSTRNSIFREDENKITVNINQLKPYFHNKTFLFELFRPFGLTGSLTDDLLKIVNGRTGGQIFTGTHRILKNRKEIIISLQSENKNKSYIAESLANLKLCPFVTAVKIISAGKELVMDPDPGTAYLDFRKISFPVTIRKWQAGDFFFPLGMNRKKKLSDYFIDGKFSRFEKEEVLILESGGDIAWIIGRRIDSRFRITNETKKVLVLKAQGYSGAKAQRLP
jgi:tRNA(Ile)-lysidine synthase